MRAYEFISEDDDLDERWVSAKRCRSPKALGNSDESQCKARGLRKRWPKDDYTDGKGNHQKGTYNKSTKYGGTVPYSGHKKRSK